MYGRDGGKGKRNQWGAGRGWNFSLSLLFIVTIFFQLHDRLFIQQKVIFSAPGEVNYSHKINLS